MFTLAIANQKGVSARRRLPPTSPMRQPNKGRGCYLWTSTRRNATSLTDAQPRLFQGGAFGAWRLVALCRRSLGSRPLVS